MRIALISDIHANLPALNAVMAHIDRLAPDLILCMGDLVGYGPQPFECLETIRSREIPCVLGNHDAAACGKMTLSFFREPNRSLLQWTSDHISASDAAWLRHLPLTIASSDLGDDSQHWLMCHASPVHPEQWQRLDSAITCRKVLGSVPYRYVFAGHTHIPSLIANELGVLGIEPEFRYWVNPGAVGQSRDSDPRASFGLLNTDAPSYQHIRVPYDVALTLSAFHDIGIDPPVARKLLNLKH